MIVFDCETNGFLENLHTIHCLVLRDLTKGETTTYQSANMKDGLDVLQRAAQAGQSIIGHNIIGYDIPALQKVYPGFSVQGANVIDTIVLTSLIWPDLKKIDAALVKRGQLPAQLSRRHSLEAWGYRLGVMKGEYVGDTAKLARLLSEGLPEKTAKKLVYDSRWDAFNEDMLAYCVQDVEVTAALYERCMKASAEKGFSDQSIELEHKVRHIIARQERYGFSFDEDGARDLTSHLLAERAKLEAALVNQFGAFYVGAGESVPTRSVRYQCPELGLDPSCSKGTRFKTMDITEGATYTKVKLVTFNPSSRDHISNRLRTIFGWEPSAFTDDGKPKVDETVLQNLNYPGIEDLQRYLMVTKRLGQVAEGSEAWLRHVKNGRIYGRVFSNGAVTGRMTHAKPNIGQVPSCSAPYGKECRSLFRATPVAAGVKKVLVGCDADALELRDLAGYMARFDGGAYIKTVLEGRKEDGTDMHSTNCRALGMDPKATMWDGRPGRDVAKTWFYAFIYGAGDEKLGNVLTGLKGSSAVKAGKKARASFMANLPALEKLVERVKAAAKKRGSLRGLDGRVIEVRSQHSGLNTLLQSAGAIQMKMALVILDDTLQTVHGLVPGIHYEFVANVHDEWQIEADESIGETIGEEAAKAIKEAGTRLQFRCPLAGQYSIGRTWAETH